MLSQEVEFLSYMLHLDIPAQVPSSLKKVLLEVIWSGWNGLVFFGLSYPKEFILTLIYDTENSRAMIY